jgi:hypothetical protein
MVGTGRCRAWDPGEMALSLPGASTAGDGGHELWTIEHRSVSLS